MKEGASALALVSTTTDSAATRFGAIVFASMRVLLYSAFFTFTYVQSLFLLLIHLFLFILCKPVDLESIPEILDSPTQGTMYTYSHIYSHPRNNLT